MAIEVAINSSSESEEVIRSQQNYITDALLDRARVDAASFYDDLLRLRNSLMCEPHTFINAVRTVNALLNTDKKRVQQSSDYFSFINNLTDIMRIAKSLYDKLDAEKKYLDDVLRAVDKFKDSKR